MRSMRIDGDGQNFIGNFASPFELQFPIEPDDGPIVECGSSADSGIGDLPTALQQDAAEDREE